MSKGFSVIMDVHFENMAIRNCDYQAAIKLPTQKHLFLMDTYFLLFAKSKWQNLIIGKW